MKHWKSENFKHHTSQLQIYLLVDPLLLSDAEQWFSSLSKHHRLSQLVVKPRPRWAPPPDSLSQQFWEPASCFSNKIP